MGKRESGENGREGEIARESEMARVREIEHKRESKRVSVGIVEIAHYREGE